MNLFILDQALIKLLTFFQFYNSVYSDFKKPKNVQLWFCWVFSQEKQACRRKRNAKTCLKQS